MLPDDVRARLASWSVGPGDPIAITFAAGVGLGLATDDHTFGYAISDPVPLVADLDAALSPRWVSWDVHSLRPLVEGGVRPARCWDIASVHQLLFGGGRVGPATAWAILHGLPLADLPGSGQLDLLSPGGDDGGDPDHPVRADGFLRPEWISGGWRRSATSLAAWAAVASTAAGLQRERLADLDARGNPILTACSESTAELMCVELQTDGLPIDRARAEQIIGAASGRRPRDDDDAVLLRAERDRAVLTHLSPTQRVELRNPAHVKAMLAAVGVDVPDTRSWRLEPFRGAHPVIGPLLDWRKAERIATTYGYGWLDDNVGADGRLRGAWTGSDGAAGRMTAQAGLHNLPAELRPAVAAEPGHVLVRADLGQVEPRVLAVVAGDADLARAGREDDLYAPVAARLGVPRDVAKVAVLAAMYGQTSGVAGEALRGLQSAYPRAMTYLDTAYDEGRAGRDVRTHGGRLIRMPALRAELDETGVRAAQGARGRYARNALVQGAAAEFFKIWAVTVRSGAAALGARIVLCLHDELLLHVPRDHADAAVGLLTRSLADAAARWQAGQTAVRFVADISVVARWSDAKGGDPTVAAPASNE